MCYIYHFFFTTFFYLIYLQSKNNNISIYITASYGVNNFVNNFFTSTEIIYIYKNN